MNKQEFLAQLREGLNGLPQEDIDERIAFYGEMIDDRLEDGLTEEEAVEAIGTTEEIAAQIFANTPLSQVNAGTESSPVEAESLGNRPFGGMLTHMGAAADRRGVRDFLAVRNPLVAHHFTLGCRHFVCCRHARRHRRRCFCLRAGVRLDRPRRARRRADLRRLSVFLFFGCVAVTSKGGRPAGKESFHKRNQTPIGRKGDGTMRKGKKIWLIAAGISVIVGMMMMAGALVAAGFDPEHGQP